MRMSPSAVPACAVVHRQEYSVLFVTSCVFTLPAVVLLNRERGTQQADILAISSALDAGSVYAVSWMVREFSRG